MPPKKSISDLEIVAATAALCNTIAKHADTLTSFPRREFAVEFNTLTEGISAGRPMDEKQTRDLLHTVKFRALQLSSSFTVDGELAKLSIWDVIALGRYKFHDDRGAPAL